MQVLISLALANTFAVLQGVQASLELEDRFRATKSTLAHANNLATRYQDAKKKAAEAKKLADAADAKRVEVEESLQVALESLTKAEERIRALELEFEQAKRAAYETGSKEAQDEMGLQLPGVCNEFYTDDAGPQSSLLLNSRRTLTLEPPSPFPSARPPLPLRQARTWLTWRTLR
jgi:ATP-dependent Clp protease ATP-binding subunit ClpA